MRHIEIQGTIWSADGENVTHYVCGDMMWNEHNIEYADWKDDDAKFEAVATLAAKGEEVVILDTGGDTYYFASLADLVPLVVPEDCELIN